MQQMAVYALVFRRPHQRSVGQISEVVQTTTAIAEESSATSADFLQSLLL